MRDRSTGELGAVTEFRAANELRELYENLYKKKYGTLPFMEENDATTFSFLASKFKGVEGTKLIEAYFTVQDRFIQENCHPVGFIRKSINRLLPAMHKASSKTDGGIRIKVNITCDACSQPYDWVGDARALTNLRRCAPCVSSNRQAKQYFASRKKLDREPMIKSMSVPQNPEAEDPEDIEANTTIDSLPSVSDGTD